LPKNAKSKPAYKREIKRPPSTGEGKVGGGEALLLSVVRGEEAPMKKKEKPQNKAVAMQKKEGRLSKNT